MRRGQPAAPVRLPHGLFLGRGPRPRQFPGHPRPLHVHREERREASTTAKAGNDAGHQGALIFPRFHQLDAVRKLVAARAAKGQGHNYLIQHSAGQRQDQQHLLAFPSAGQSAQREGREDLRLRRRHHGSAGPRPAVAGRHLPDRTRAGRGEGDRPGLEATGRGADRRHEDRHHHLAEVPLRAARPAARGRRGESGEGHRRGESSRPRSGKPRSRRGKYAVIVDEAHSSQTGETARELKAILGAAAEGGRTERRNTDWEDRLTRSWQSRGQQPNLSFFAFTATPKGKTLELFGRPGASGKPEAFHTLQHAAGDRGGLHPRRAAPTTRPMPPTSGWSRRWRTTRTCPSARRRGRWPSS